MTRLEIKPLLSVNNANYGLSKGTVRAILGLKFKESENHLDEPEVQELHDRILDIMAEISGKTKEYFLEFSKEIEPYMHADDNDDFYDGFTICYDEALKFEAIEIYAYADIKLIINGKDYSSFKLKDFLAIADDFISDEEGYYTSYSKQIGITVSTEDETLAEAILFGKPGYYTR